MLADLGTEGMPLERACAAAVRLLDLGYFRIGNDVYADEQRQLRADHAASGGTCARQRDALVFSFVGKSGVEHRITIDDPVVDRGARRDAPPARRRRPAARLEGRPALDDLDRPPTSTTTSATSTGLEATAKDFRTWHATVIAAAALAETRRAGRDQGLAQAGRVRRR